MADYPVQDSLVNEINSSISDYDVLMGEASKLWGQSSTDIEDLMRRVAFHESKSDPKAWQILNDGSYGRGRGLYQFETGRGQGGHTAATRLKRYFGYTPEDTLPEDLSWLNITDEGFDASKLSPEQQNMLFLANYMGKKGEESGMSGVNPENLNEWWFREHNAGPDSTKESRMGSFNRDMKDFPKLKDYSGEY